MTWTLLYSSKANNRIKKKILHILYQKQSKERQYGSAGWIRESLLCKGSFYIGTASVVGTKEGEGPLADAFDCIGPDDKFGQQTWEAAESSLQKEALTLALGKADQKPEDMRYLFAGDLLGQLIASSLD